MTPIRTCNHLGRRQRGLATLLIALIIMVSVTLVVIFTAQTAVLEQRMSGNEVRTKQANLAAQAGLEHAMAYMQQSNVPADLSDDGDDDNFTYRATFLQVQDAAGNKVSGMDLGGIDNVCPENPANFPSGAIDALRKQWTGDGEPGPDDSLKNAVVLACGWSDDFSGRSAVMVGMQAGPAVANPPDNPLLARGGIDVVGNAGVYNAYTNLTIRTGQEAVISGNAGTTYMRDPTQPPPTLDEPVPEPGPDNMDPRYLEMSAKDNIGTDVVDFDPSLNQGTGDEFFENFMGTTKEEYRANIAAHRLDQSDLDATDDDGNSISYDKWGQSIWIDGNGDDVTLRGQVGNRDNPVVLVVDGNLRLAGFFNEFHGVLYVTGDFTGQGNPDIYGAAVIAGDADIEDDVEVGGRPNFVFDPVAAGGGASVGARGTMSGTWRDWSN